MTGEAQAPPYLIRLVMGISSLFVLAVGLSMDAFAVAICKGLAIGHPSPKASIAAGLWFGVFQALMPLIGYFIGIQFTSLVSAFDHWIAFVLLLVIGASMIKEAFGKDEEETASIGIRTMFPLAVATSIDALASGIALAAVDGNIFIAVSFIGLITFALSAFGVRLGAIAGAKYRSKAELCGGIILIAIGLKILIEHMAEGI